MKTTRETIRKTLYVAIITAASLLGGSGVIASDKVPDSSGKEVTVQYLGTVYGQPLFQLNIQNRASENLFISLENMNGEVLYTQKSTAQFFSKKIQLATTETNISLYLKVYSSGTKKTQVFEINKVTVVSDDLVINQKTD